MRSTCLIISMLIVAVANVLAQSTVTTSGGNTNSVPKFTGSSTIGNSVISDNGGVVGIGDPTPSGALTVLQNSAATGFGGTANGNQGIIVNNNNDTPGRPIGIEFGTWKNGNNQDYTFSGLYGVGTSLGGFTQG